MTTGALIFAQNNAQVDYVKLAIFAGLRIKKFLNIPVSIVTDNTEYLLKNYPNHGFDQVIETSTPQASKKTFHDGTLTSKVLEWKNLSRPQIYDVTPYEKTLVIDSDYIINSDILKGALERDYDFQIYSKSFDLSGWRPTNEFERINQYSIPFYWATTFIFVKTPATRAFFELVNYVKENWLYYRVLYNIDASIYRNDHAFSIAIHIMNGKTVGDFAVELPGKMTYCIDKDILLKLDNNKLQFLVEKENHLGEYILAKTNGIDVHVMNKMSLTRCIDEGNYV
jgi:hypothetical protein